jgi:hypothetical protein
LDTREQLRRRPDVDERDLDDIIAVAGRLQQDDRDFADSRVDVKDVEKVAKELDIAPEYVEKAITRIKQDRIAADAASAAAKARTAEMSAANAKIMKTVAGIVGGVLVLLGLMTGVATVSASTRMNAAANDTALAASNLEVVLDREASLAPQLLGLAGGDPSTLATLAADVSGADTVRDRLSAVASLDAKLASELGKLPPPTDASASTRGDVQTELIGVQNRITTERRRYEQSKTAWENAANGPAARLALGLGLARRPPE